MDTTDKFVIIRLFVLFIRSVGLIFRFSVLFIRYDIQKRGFDSSRGRVNIYGYIYIYIYMYVYRCHHHRRWRRHCESALGMNICTIPTEQLTVSTDPTTPS